jgi:phosphate-selective porin OprO/OprP
MLLLVPLLTTPVLGQDSVWVSEASATQERPVVPFGDFAQHDLERASSLEVQSVSHVPTNQTESASEEILELKQRLETLEKSSKEAATAKKKLPSVAVNGVFQADAVMFNQTEASREAHGPIESGANFRRARLSAKGSVVENMNYFMQMDFGFFGRPTFTDVWTEFNDIPVLGNVRVGQWKQPFSLEVVSSFRYTTMMERATVFQAFTPFRGLGLGFYDHSEDLNTTWAASMFRTGQDQFGGSLSTNGGNGLAGRLTHLGWYEGAHGEDYLHLGCGYFLNAPPREFGRFRSIPEIFVGEFVPSGVGTSGQVTPALANGTPFFVDTRVVPNVTLVNTYGLEALWVRGPLSLQTEGMAAVVDQETNPTALLGGGYATVGYFITGEHRPYDRKAGAIDRVIPKCNFKKGGGLGAWEVAGRWSYLDVTDETIVGGSIQNLTVGINWYTNPYCKFVFNYIHSWSESPNLRGLASRGQPLSDFRIVNNQTDAFGFRCQLDF